MSTEAGVVATTFAQVPEWLLEEDVSSRAIHLYAVLQGMAGQKGSAWPTRKTLAVRMRCSPDTVDRAVEELARADALRVEERFSEDGDRTSNRYVLLSERPDLRGRGRMDAQTGGGTSAQAGNQTKYEPDQHHHTAPDGAEALDGMAPVDEPNPTLDGMPLSADPGHTWTETLANWITGEGHGLPPRDRRDESYAAVVRHVDAHVAKSYPQRTGLFVGVLADYVSDVAEVDLANGARGHLGRLVKTHGPVEALRGLTEAVVWGAGLDEHRKPDIRDLTKYATAVINGKGKS